MGLLTRTLDAALDVAVVPGYTRIGSTVRRRFWPADPQPFPSPVDIVVTGAGSGLGAATAESLAGLGARVHLVGRTRTRLDATAAAIARTNPGAQVRVHTADISDLDSVARLAATVHSEVGELHALIHCAGVMPTTRTQTAQGHESAFATHVLGPVALTFAVRELFTRSSRVIFVSSGGMYPVPLRFTDFEFTTGEYKGITAYARTKRMQVVIAEQLAAAFTRSEDPVVHSMHPGWAATPGVSDALPGFGRLLGPLLRTASEGADTIVWLAASDDALAENGLFWHDRAPRSTHYPLLPKDLDTARDALWRTVIDQTGVSTA